MIQGLTHSSRGFLQLRMARRRGEKIAVREEEGSKRSGVEVSEMRLIEQE